jgi:hypothetical protein
MSEPRRITERYHLEKRVSAKESGPVFLARDSLTGEPVAVKLFNAEDAEARRELFQATARAMQELRHPALPRILDFGLTTAGSAYLVTEDLHGQSFETLSGAPAGRTLELLLLAVDGLEALHAAGLAHGNLRLDNLFLIDGPVEQVKLLGLGSSVLRPDAEGAGGGFQADLRDFAELLAEVLRVTARKEDGRLLVDLPLETVGGLKSPAALGAFLEDALLGDPAGRFPTWEAVRGTLRRALTGEPRKKAPAAAPAKSTEDTRSGVGTVRVSMAELRQMREGGDTGGHADVAAAEGATRILRLEDVASAAPAPPAPEAPPAPTRKRPASGTVRISMAELAAEVAAASPDPTPDPIPDPTLEDTVPRLSGPVPFPVPPSRPRKQTDTQELEAFRAGATAQPTPPPVSEPAPLPPPLVFPVPAPPPAAASPTLLVTPLPAPPPPAPEPRFAIPAAASLPEVAPTRIPAPAPAPRRQAQGKPPMLLLAAGGGLGLLVVLAVGGFLFWRSRATPKPPPKPPAVVRKVAPPVVVAPTPAPPPPLNPQIQLAEGFVIAGDLASAKAAIEAIPPEQVLSVEEQERVQRVLDALAPLQTDQFAEALAKALNAGDPKQIKAAVDAIGPDRAAALAPAAKRNLAKARKILDLDARLTRAEKEGGPLDVVRQASLLLTEQPRNSRANQSREGAAASLEAEADAKAQQGQLDAALAQFEQLRGAWPTRRGLAERIDRLRDERRADQEMEDVLAAVIRLEKANKPQEGLKVLAGTKPAPKFADRFRELRARLETQAAQADQRAPSISLGATAASLAFEKGQVLTIPLRIADDLAVQSVEGWLRPEGGRYTQVSVRQLSGSAYEMEVSPDLHQNKSVDVYLVATDGSGHKGQLGDAAHPVRIKRKGIFSKIFGKKD